jgi:hypothetical protein
MLKNGLFGFFFLLVSGLMAQEIKTPYQSKKIAVSKDTIVIDSVSINKSFFKILDSSGNEIDPSFYSVNFQKGTLLFSDKFPSVDSLTIRYLKFPEFLTREYSIYNDSQIVSNDAGMDKLYAISRNPISTYKPFDGLNTSGSITRGITVGNNQNSVVNSNLDLQISGKISDKISLRASIQDSNIPLQEGGYSQKLDEFDQIFIELFSDKWSIRAGDLFLENRQSRFLNFNKKVQGISTNFVLGTPEKKTTIDASAALVRGQYSKSLFTGLEGNQGPYKLIGANGELYVLIISGSERVFVNGILLERGENNQYVIDYNAGEITFTSLYPITSEMRIVVEYQYSQQNYARLITYGGVTHQQEKWSVGGHFYSENDIKNQTLQQNLTAEQVAILQAAGDDSSQMNAPSAYVDSYSENKILYRKVLVGGFEVFEYSNNPEDVLYNVRFSLVGMNQGNYILANNQTIGRIYQYLAPIAGIPQGNYEPIFKLVPPVKLQIATVNGKYTPSEKTTVDFELALSNNDKNLYSSMDDDDNQGIATRVNARQRLLSGKGTLDAFANFLYVEQKFQPIERLFTIEFDRDWSFTNAIGNQNLLITGLDFKHPEKGFANYQFEQLSYSKNFSGNRHVLNGLLTLKNWQFQTQGSVMRNTDNQLETQFIRNQSQVRYHFDKNWVGGTFRMEDVEQKDQNTQLFIANSQRFSEYGTFVGRGDSTKIFVELGYLHRVNDSLRVNTIQRVNYSQSYYFKSKLIQNEQNDLAVFVNYRNLKFSDETIADQPSLNSRLLYNGRFFNQMVLMTTAYENSSGTIAQLEFTYIEVEPGLGVYIWIDYNNNGIQELSEFEVAPFPDQAKYVRVFLPNQQFVQTHQNKFSQALTLNPLNWQNKTGAKKFISQFYNQTSFLMDRKTKREADNFNLNPFFKDDEDLLGLTMEIRNSLFYNRGKQKHSVTYTFINNRVKNLLSVGSQENLNLSHQMQYVHLFKKSWLFSLFGKTIDSKSEAENFEIKNFEITGYLMSPKIAYLFSQNTSLDFFYEFQNKENNIIDFEVLKQQRLGTSFTYVGKKQFTLNGELSFYNNDFTGNAVSAVGFQMLEGLQPGRNQTWRVLVQKNLTKFLDVNLNYQGRNSETSQVIHTGSVQLRAYF